MSILSVANVHFEATGDNRIEYLAANGLLNIITTGNIAISSRNFSLSNNPGSVGNVLTSNGTSWISQALPPSLPGTGASGNVLTSNGTSWISSTPTVNLSTQTTGTINLTTQTVSTINLLSQVAGVLPAANGGTGLASSGTTGNVLTSNGTTWVSQAISIPAAGGTSAFGTLY